MIQKVILSVCTSLAVFLGALHIYGNMQYIKSSSEADLGKVSGWIQIYDKGTLKATCTGTTIGPDGKFLTAAHCILKGNDVKYKVVFKDGTAYDATIKKISDTVDAALLQLKNNWITPYAKLGKAEKLQVGDTLYNLGNGVDKQKLYKKNFTYVTGKIVALHTMCTDTSLDKCQDFILAKMYTLPGDSGSAVFNDKGKVVGVLTRGFVDHQHSMSVSIDIVKKYLLG